MKIRNGYVSNSSSSSYIVYIEKDIYPAFRNDLEKFIEGLGKIFPRFDDENFYIEEKKKTKEDFVVEYIKEVEGVKHPSQKMIKFFTKELEKEGKFNLFDNYVEIEYTIDTECYDTIGFQYLCQTFIENYNKNKK